MRHVIVGGGMAGTSCAEALRILRPKDEIVLISEEQHPLYSRVLLSDYVKALIPRERLFLKKEAWYATQRIEWLPGLRAEALDAKNHFVALSDGRELPYDKLLLASGGEPKTLPDDLRGVSYLRTLDDADHLRQLLSERTKTAVAAVYGSGFIAAEYLDIFSHFHLPTTIAFRGSWFWSKVLDEPAGTWINKTLETQGIPVIPNAPFLGLQGDDEIEICETGAKNVPCSILGVGVGVKPDLSWLHEAGIETGCGTKTNEFLETNLPDIYAAGDGTEYFDLFSGTHRRAANWMNATMQGRVVAKTLAGERTPYRLVTSYASNLFGIEIIFIGDTDRRHADETILRGSVEEGGLGYLFLKRNHLVGAALLNRNTDRMPITGFIDRRIEIQRKKELKDPSYDLKNLLA
ncbi:MAG TPA: FAD/NAD(P)-binding oxidoreductase [Patescibacteria group bacterium]|nr:FAD/NAD(P)-binding oxidoreductase [Patescibacteria group bacterium]